MQKHERIQYAIEQSGKQKNEIAKLCHVKPPAVTQWTSGPKAIRDMNLFSLARATGFRAEWLSLGIGPMKSPTTEGQMEVIGLIGADGPMTDDEVELSYYEQKGDVTDSAKIEFAQIAESKLRFSKEMLEVAGVEISFAAVARLRGRSMERLILDGSAVGFDMSVKQVVDGEIYAFEHNGCLRVTYLSTLPDGGIRVHSENSSEYPDEALAIEELSNITILGRVFWWSTVRRPLPV